jgi:hypothetical protein
MRKSVVSWKCSALAEQLGMATRMKFPIYNDYLLFLAATVALYPYNVGPSVGLSVGRLVTSFKVTMHSI